MQNVQSLGEKVGRNEISMGFGIRWDLLIYDKVKSRWRRRRVNLSC